MANFIPLHQDSQSGGVDVLYLDADAPPTDLWETADYRMEVAYRLLRELAGVKINAGDDLTSAVASAAAMLLSDARAVNAACYRILLDIEKAAAVPHPADAGGELPDATRGLVRSVVEEMMANEEAAKRVGEVQRRGKKAGRKAA